jgi:hypothetical protein
MCKNLCILCEVQGRERPEQMRAWRDRASAKHLTESAASNGLHDLCA